MLREISRDATVSHAGNVSVPLLRHVAVVAEVVELVLELREVHIRHGLGPSCRSFNGPVHQLRAKSFACQNSFLGHGRAPCVSRRTVVCVNRVLSVRHFIHR